MYLGVEASIAQSPVAVWQLIVQAFVQLTWVLSIHSWTTALRKSAQIQTPTLGHFESNVKWSRKRNRLVDDLESERQIECNVLDDATSQLSIVADNREARRSSSSQIASVRDQVELIVQWADNIGVDNCSRIDVLFASLCSSRWNIRWNQTNIMQLRTIDNSQDCVTLQLNSVASNRDNVLEQVGVASFAHSVQVQEDSLWIVTTIAIEALQNLLENRLDNRDDLIAERLCKDVVPGKLNWALMIICSVANDRRLIRSIVFSNFASELVGSDSNKQVVLSEFVAASEKLNLIVASTALLIGLLDDVIDGLEVSAFLHELADSIRSDVLSDDLSLPFELLEYAVNNFVLKIGQQQDKLAVSGTCLIKCSLQSIELRATINRNIENS